MTLRQERINVRFLESLRLIVEIVEKLVQAEAKRR